MNPAEREEHLNDCAKKVFGAMSYNLGRTIELIWNSRLSTEDEAKEWTLRRAAHYLGLELDIVLEQSEEEKEWDEKEVPSKPIAEDPSFQVEGKCIGCGNYTLLNRESGLCDICVSKGVMETESP